MRKYEEGLLYDKSQVYFNTPIIDYSKKKEPNESNEDSSKPKELTQPKEK